MNAIAIPETTLRLLEAMKSASVTRVIISGTGQAPIDYLPMKNKHTSIAIEKAGLGDLVRQYFFECTRKNVLHHFRPGVYDVSGGVIRVIE